MGGCAVSRVKILRDTHRHRIGQEPGTAALCFVPKLNMYESLQDASEGLGDAYREAPIRAAADTYILHAEGIFLAELKETLSARVGLGISIVQGEVGFLPILATSDLQHRY